MNHLSTDKFTVETVQSEGGELIANPEISQFSTLEEAKQQRLEPFLAYANQHGVKPNVYEYTPQADCVGCAVLEARYNVKGVGYALLIYPPAPVYVKYRNQNLLMSQDLMDELGFRNGQHISDTQYSLFQKANEKRMLAKYIE